MRDDDIFALFIIAAAFLLFLLYAASRRSAQRERERRQQREIQTLREARQEEEEAQVATLFWLNLKDSFPYLHTPEISDPTADRIFDRISSLLSSHPSYGTIVESNGLPVPAVPEKYRRRHFYVVGKTGAGKTTFLEHRIREDLIAGRGVGVFGPEGEFFRERLLPLVPPSRANDVVYFAPGNPSCPLKFNPLALSPGDDRARAAEDLFTIFKRVLADAEMGPRMQPILQNSFAALVGRPGMTLWHVSQLLTDPAFRQQVLADTPDPYVRGFWSDVYPQFPRGAELPILTRLDRFLRPEATRRVLRYPTSTFSVADALNQGRILLVDLYGLSEETRLLFGQMLFSKIQLELMRRELAGGSPRPFYLYADEFQSVVGAAEGTWRELLSRGRKYGLALTLANQFPAQLPLALQNEIFGNVASFVSFALGAKDAAVARREFLHAVYRQGDPEPTIQPIPREELIELPVGRAYCKLAGGRAVKVQTTPPLQTDALWTTAVPTIIETSWSRYGPDPDEPPPDFSTPAPPTAPEDPDEPTNFRE